MNLISGLIDNRIENIVSYIASVTYTRTPMERFLSYVPLLTMGTTDGSGYCAF